MKAGLKVLISFCAWIVIIGYLIFSLSYSRRQQDKLELTGLNIVLKDSIDYQFINREQVKTELNKAEISLLNKEVKSLNTRMIEQMIKKNNFVAEASVFVDIKGELTIEISQRKPIVRFSTSKGENFYVTEDNFILPTQSTFACYVPIVTGQLFLPFESGYIGYFDENSDENQKKHEKNYEFFCKLINFVKFIRESEFWNAQIVQINVVEQLHSHSSQLGIEGPTAIKERKSIVELVPRAGDCIIMLGSLDDFEQKLEKLMRFYNEALPFEGWKHAKKINLMYDGQIVVSN